MYMAGYASLFALLILQVLQAISSMECLSVNP